jgi:signal transduction histidine kinase
MSSVDISKLNTALIIICGIVLLLIILLVFFVVLLRKRHNFFLKEKELMQARYEQVLLQSQLEIQEQAFTQISSEIHDNIGQLLSLVRININTLKNQEDAEKIKFTDEILGKAIADLRHLSHNLHTDHIVKEGFTAAAQNLLSGLAQTKLYKTELSSTDDLSDLSDEKILILFRIVQEAINNIVKHAQASAIKIEIQQTNSGRRINIIDDGIGMISNVDSNGLGLKNMVSRAKIIGANISIHSRKDEGTQVSIEL